MKKLHLQLLAIAVSTAFSTCALAQELSKPQYKVNKENISAAYKREKAACSSMSGNANDICVEEAKAKEKIAKADLEKQYKPGIKTTYKAKVAKAEAEYAVAKERCDDQAGNAKDVCVKEAKAIETTALADAKMTEKTSDVTANAKEKVMDARKEASDDKATAQYKLATEKCDSLAGQVKVKCVADAKLQYGN
jgi:hypothetical protein